MRSRMVSFAAALITGAGLVITANGGVATAAPTARNAAPAGGRVIVVLKGQAQAGATRASSLAVPASSATAQAQQSSVSSAITHSGGSVTYRGSLVNAIAGTVSSSEASALAKRSDVAAVIPDSMIRTPSADVAAAAAVAPPETTPAAGVCPTNPSAVQLGPEALRVTNANSDVPGAKTARSLGYDGAGVKVAFMAEGIDINNPDFLRNGKTIFSDYKDFSGDGLNTPTDGAEAFLDASAIAAQGNKVYDVSHFSNRVLNRPCKIRIEGEAPGVSLVGLKVFGLTSAPTSGFLQAIEYAVNVDHVNVLSQSFGGNPLPSTAQDVIKAADEAAIAKGVTVVASTGDAGITNTIASPADDPAVIAAGASTTYQMFLQSGYGGARLPGIHGWVSNNISSLSSAGFTTGAGTVTLVAPGELNYAVCSTDLKMYEGCADYAGNPSGLESSGGTSESAPIIAGVTALIMQAYKQSHHGQAPSPATVKNILTSSAKDIGAPAEQQGAGLVDAYAAVVLAKGYGGTTAASVPVVQSSASSFSAVAAPGSRQTFTDTVTNRATTTQKVALSGRTLGDYARLATTTVTLSDATSAKYVDFQGLTDNIATVHFTVPAGKDRLSSSIAWQAASADLSARVRLTLVDPKGRLVAYSVPQGIGNYGHVEVAAPVAGKWTAYVQSRESGTGGTQGPVKFAVSTANYGLFATISPSSLTLAPGKSAKVTVATSTKSSPGDRSGSLVITPAGGAATTVPVTLRSLIPTGFQRFNQTLTGPNGRGEGVGFHYNIDVAAGTAELNAAVNLPGNPNNPYQAMLVSPGGNAVAFGSSVAPRADGVLAQLRGVQLHALAPTSGRWGLVINFDLPVSGTEITTPFTVTTDQTARTATAPGLPTSASTVLTAGKPVTVHVKVKNTGPSAESFFVDGRLNSTTTYHLASLSGATTQVPGGSVPAYVVPTHTSAITESLTTTGSRPVQFDSMAPLGDPDLASTAGTTASLSYSADPVSQGVWVLLPAQVGPFATAPTPEPATASMTATTRAFDPAVTSSTGDLWLGALDPSTSATPVTVAPGQTADITVTITPTGTHRVVHGTLFVSDLSVTFLSEGSIYSQPVGNDVVALPYTYTVK
jgi:Subtilase family/Peptidase inhibitor I9